jgi:hypothetical protein
MMLKREVPPQKRGRASHWLRQVGAGVLATATALALAAGCLQRPVQPQDPVTSNLFVDQIVQTAVDKIDLLFMIDNSISMADKQRILRDAVPVLVQRLVTPACVDRMGNPTGGNVDAMGRCNNGGEPEFAAIKDIHIGIVTSSLGDMGSGDACKPGDPDAGQPRKDDKAYLLAYPGIRTEPLNSWNNMGFLAWDPDAVNPARARNKPVGGTTNSDTLIADFSAQVIAAGEQGCGYEASLEAWYRFLIDPEPPGIVEKVTISTPAGDQQISQAGPTDATILAQREAFLRADSLVAIIMLSDENDCSIIDYGQGWIVGLQAQGDFFMPRATAACDSDPNSACCFSCSIPAGSVPGTCTAPSADTNCAKGVNTKEEDHPNLRCYQQKRRFGFDLLHPIQKYVQGLTQPSIYNPRRGDISGNGTVGPEDTVPNPLFKEKDGKRRDRSLVFLAGIVGVPWQDIATEESWSDPRKLEYMTYDEMEQAGRWDWILAHAGQPPSDALMYETSTDRTTITTLPQQHPAGAVGGQLVPSNSMQQLANPINGHEANIQDGADLQYACTFQLTEATPDCNDVTGGCDCRDEHQAYNRPLCQGTRQTHAKAYPGTRHLEVLREVGKITGNSIVASICPKVSNAQGRPEGDPNYGYNPAVSAIIDRLKEALKGKCLPRPLQVGDQGEVPCVVVEARVPEGGTCQPCGGDTTPGRTNLDAPEIDPVVRAKLEDGGFCGVSGGTACESYCLCQINQYQGQDLVACQQQSAEPVDPKGYCYVDGAQGPAQAAITANCPASQQRLLRFASEVPIKGAVAFIACLGKSLSTATAVPTP